MVKILTAVCKEIVLLSRDRTGLLVLFLMPALLVVIITLVQVNVMELTGQKKTRILFHDLDGGRLGTLLGEQLRSAHFEIIAADPATTDVTEVEELVNAGRYRLAILISRGSSAALEKKASSLLAAEPDAGNEAAAIPPESVRVYFDPGIMPGFRSGLSSQLHMALAAVAMKMKLAALAETLEEVVVSYGLSPEATPLPLSTLDSRLEQPLLEIDIDPGDEDTPRMAPYNPVQQNVAAWALFGMFFTALPIAGSLLEERKSGIWHRLKSMPVSQLQLFFGKMLAYIGVCFCQFLLIWLIGAYLFPLLDLPAFTVSPRTTATVLTIVAVSLAVCGYGLFLGLACNTYEQAFMIGATSVVAAAAVGGVMVPVYAMPQLMQQLSILSPINWGLNALQELLIRNSPASTVISDFFRLAGFALITLLGAWKLSRSRL